MLASSDVPKRSCRGLMAGMLRLPRPAVGRNVLLGNCEEGKVYASLAVTSPTANFQPSA